MGKASWQLTMLLGLAIAGCDFSKSPRMALPTHSSKSPEAHAESHATSAVQQVKVARYQGRTAEEWSQALSHEDLDHVRQAAMALKVLRAEGRPFLMKGLENPLPETRRLCLECLTVSDLRSYGDDGRKALVKLAGDRMDLRIRERATQYLIEWDRSLPAP